MLSERERERGDRQCLARGREDKEALLPFERQIEVMGLNQGFLYFNVFGTQVLEHGTSVSLYLASANGERGAGRNNCGAACCVLIAYFNDSGSILNR